MASGSACKNHPRRKTSRNCFQCNAPICHPCTLHLDRHYFCSTACHALWLQDPAPKRVSKKQRIKARRRGAIPKTAAPAASLATAAVVETVRATNAEIVAEGPATTLAEASAKAEAAAEDEVALPEFSAADFPAETLASPPATRISPPIIIRQATAPQGRLRWAALFALNAAAIAILGVYLLQTRVPKPAKVTPAMAALPAPTLFGPATTSAAVITVHGSAPGAVTIAVLVNGKRTGAVSRNGAAFTSGNLPLETGTNVIQVRAQAAHEPFPRYSLAHLVQREPATIASDGTRPLLLHRGPVFRDISRGDPGRQAVSFTFDGGSEANAAVEILDVLRAQGVVTTLFLTGEFIRKFPDIVRLAVADGHEIGNHTDTHPHLTSYNQNQSHTLLPHITEAFFKEQLTGTEAAYQAITGKPMAPFWRAPYGEVNAQLQAWAGELGYRHVGWTRRVGKVSTLDSLDWVNDKDSHLYLSGTELKQRFVGLVREDAAAVQGGIFLMHLGTERKTDKIHAQLAEILAAYKTAGFEILPVSQLAR